MKKAPVVTSEEAEPPSLPEETEPPSIVAGAAGPRVSRPQLSLHLPGKAGLPINPRTQRFLRRHFPETTAAEWNSWRWQLRNRFRTLAELETILRLSADERQAIASRGENLPLAMTPYYASLLDERDPRQPLRRCVVPAGDEFLFTAGEADDPLEEDSDSPVPGLVHRYPDRVLFLATGFCSTYCRYCTRSRLVGHHVDHRLDIQAWERALAYIEATPSVRDVLLSGGDPLTLPDDKIEWLLWRLSRISHVEFVRIGTKVPAVLPQRITPALIRRLRKYHPLWVSVHFTHPDELTPEATAACARLADAGIPLGSQTVLLAGINDDIAVMKRLMHGLLKARVKPYYLYQCDPIPGSSHFRTPVDTGLEIIHGLRGHTSGYAVPTYVIDAPGGGGKIPLLPDYVAGRDGDDLLLRNYAGETYRYPDPDGRVGPPRPEEVVAFNLGSGKSGRA